MEETSMSEWVKLKAADGHELSAYIARPEGEAIGALVVIQEIFGVNAHIRSVADGYAQDGFVVIAPALFDRSEKGVELKYEGDDLKKAYELYQKLNPVTALQDIAAAYDHLKSEGNRRHRLLLRRLHELAKRHSRRDRQNEASLCRRLLPRGRR
jgi:carboxymethylenebutenolidase